MELDLFKLGIDWRQIDLVYISVIEEWFLCENIFHATDVNNLCIEILKPKMISFNN